MPRYKLTIEYDGTGLAGWQRQDQQPSVQSLLEEAVLKFCGSPCDLVCAGRTDAGVHALAQVAHLDLPKDYEPFRVQQGINFHLLPDLRVIVVDSEIVTEEFHARFCATQRSYLYRILNRRTRPAIDRNRAWHIVEPLDAARMHQAAQTIVGHHDFTTFRDSKCQAKSPMKTLERLDVITVPSPGPSRKREGGSEPSPACGGGLGGGSGMDTEIHIIAEARSFLHHQVRNMVGALRLIGNDKWDTGTLKAALDAKDRRQGGETAPPEGLYLTQVKY